MRIFLAIIILFLSFASHAQKMKFHQGYLVGSAGDTLKGLLYWKKNGAQENLWYKKSESEEAKAYPWNELKYAYDKEEENAFMVRTVKINLEYADPEKYIIGLDDSIATKTIPLTSVYVGRRLSLYRFYDRVNYYFLYDGSKLFQLVQNYRYLTNTERFFDIQRAPKYYVFDQFKGTLSGFYDFSNDKKLKYMLDNALFEERTLHSLVSKMDKNLN